ncbi:MAG: nickel pincer cofactor biosynthesis protein LarC [Archaeoglobaceae archaeon]|nr:nickel pincer cofactor biosynthesis protein LarC [Archaeoglobaceae archaeon]MCX8151992.1 nickel pincer cofactor biosynthesis protein LarC [Archaeoglobaceae archaeon]MDW8013381.1 nickel pincer cofactor biosynthesis protein LarC [Archaeoglobaceae archaeon]
MKVAIFDAFSGASGDMIVASLLGVSLSKEDLKSIVESTKIEVSFNVKEVKKKGLNAKRVEVLEKKFVERSYDEIKKVVDKAEVDEKAKIDALKIFESLAEAEKKVHGEGKFHEVGSDDAIFDVLSSAVGIRNLISKGYKLYAKPLRLGSGFVQCKHGLLPVPAPVTLEVLKKSKVEVLFDGKGELLTPTAAAVIGYYCEKYLNFPLKIEDISYGAGTLELEHPNVLRLILGERSEKDSVVLLETNIDDVSCEIIGYAAEKLRGFEGVLDVWILSAVGKKSRPTFELKVLTKEEKSEEIAEKIMEITGTLGVRVLPIYHRKIAEREVLKREVEILGKKFEVKYKISSNRLKPEFDDVVKVAEDLKVPLMKVIEKVVRDADPDR